MIEEKQKLIGNLSVKKTLSGSLNNSVIYIDPITQEKEAIPTREIQEIVPDIGYTGLSKVKVKGYIPKVEKKVIKKNGVYKSEDEELDGYSEVSVETSGVDINEYFDGLISCGSSNFDGLGKIIKKIPDNLTIDGSNTSFMFSNCSLLETIPLLDTSNVTNMQQMFNNCSSLTNIPQLNTSKVTNMAQMFYGCSLLETIPMLDTSNVTNMQQMFIDCSSLTNIPQLNTSKVTNMAQMFMRTRKIKTIPMLDTSNVTNMTYMFYSDGTLETIPQLDTSKVTNMSYMFGAEKKLHTVPQLNASKVTSIGGIFMQCANLENVGGFVNLGEAYLTTTAANNSNYTLELNYCTKLTHESLMNIINNLYDIKSKGCNSQKLTLGTANKTKLTVEEIAIATSKGWTVS